MINQYYILEVTKAELPNLVSTMTDEVKAMFVQKIDTVRFNNNNTKCVVKLTIGTTEVPGIISHLTGYSHTDIKIELSKTEWTTE